MSKSLYIAEKPSVAREFAKGGFGGDLVRRPFGDDELSGGL